MTEATPRKLSHYFTASRRKGRADLPLMSVTMHNGLVRRDELDRKMDSALTPEEHLLVEPNDIAYNTMRMWQGCFGLAEEAANVSPAYVVMRPKDTVDPRFAAHWFKSDRGLYMLWAYSYGLTEDRLRLYGDEFLLIPVVWPDVAAQSRIASVLDGWDEAIAVANSLAVQKDKMRRSLSRRVFPLFRDVSKLPQLHKFKLREHCKIIRGIAYDPKSDLSKQGVGVLTAAHVQSGELSLAADRTTVRASIVKSDQIIQAGDFLIAMSNGSKNLVGKAGLVRNFPSAPLGAGAFCATARPKNEQSIRLLDHALRSQRYSELLHVQLAGSSIGNLTEGDLRNFEFFWTGNPQDLVLLDELGLEVRQNQASAALLRRQKRGLMQKLLTGEWPVPESIDRLMPGGDAAATLAREASAA